MTIEVIPCDGPDCKCCNDDCCTDYDCRKRVERYIRYHIRRYFRFKK